MNIKCYDNGGESADQYTVVFLDYPERYPGLYLGFAMDDAPSHPQGVGMTCVVQPGRHLGKLIAFKDLPKACQRAVKNLLESDHD
jgi:hypothetical protein